MSGSSSPCPGATLPPAKWCRSYTTGNEGPVVSLFRNYFRIPTGVLLRNDILDRYE